MAERVTTPDIDGLKADLADMSKCAGGYAVVGTSGPCPHCGATEDDPCRFAASPVPGMETTEEERKNLHVNALMYAASDAQAPFGWSAEAKDLAIKFLPKLISDFDRLSAEVTRLRALLGRAGATTVEIANAREAAAREEERQACAAIAKSLATAPGLDTALTIERMIRARSQP